MRKLKTPEDIIKSNIDYVDFASDKTLLAYSDSIKRIIIAAQRDALECAILHLSSLFPEYGNKEFAITEIRREVEFLKPE